MKRCLVDLYKKLKKYTSDFFIDSATKRFIDFNRRSISTNKLTIKKSEVLVELYNVSQTVIAFSLFSRVLGEFHNAKLISFSISTRNPYLYIKRYRSLYKIFESFGVIKHINTKLIKRKKAAEIAEAMIISLKNKEDVLDLTIDGCPIGCEIYESYLMDNYQPTVDFLSKEFLAHLTECLALYFFWDKYFKSHDVKALVMSHAIYRYGIISKVAIKNGIPIYLPSIRSMYCLRDFSDIPVSEFDQFHEKFERLPEDIKVTGLEWAKAQLGRRFNGEIGVDMAYSTKSAFNKTEVRNQVLKKNDRLKVLITTHCFFDNPNAYGRNIFPDFYEWLKFLGEISDQTEYDWYLKCHPDVLPGNDEIIGKILKRYPKIIKLPEAVSHLQLAEEGISVVLTVYGSVGHEYPLLGKLVINAGNNNPHSGYNFNIHPNSIEKYKALLLDLSNININININDVYEYYYMNYKFNICESLFLKSYKNFLDSLGDFDKNSSPAYEYFLNQHTPEQQTILENKIYCFIESQDFRYYENSFINSSSRI